MQHSRRRRGTALIAGLTLVGTAAFTGVSTAGDDDRDLGRWWHHGRRVWRRHRRVGPGVHGQVRWRAEFAGAAADRQPCLPRPARVSGRNWRSTRSMPPAACWAGRRPRSGRLGRHIDRHRQPDRRPPPRRGRRHVPRRGVVRRVVHRDRQARGRLQDHVLAGQHVARLHDYDDDDLYFRTAPSDVLQGRVLAELMIADGSPTAATLALPGPLR